MTRLFTVLLVFLQWATFASAQDSDSDKRYQEALKNPEYMNAMVLAGELAALCSVFLELSDNEEEFLIQHTMILIGLSALDDVDEEMIKNIEFRLPHTKRYIVDEDAFFRGGSDERIPRFYERTRLETLQRLEISEEELAGENPKRIVEMGNVLYEQYQCDPDV